VLVRGGPFKNMELLYPNPKCKFGRRDMIVPAQYVTCTEHPLSVEEIEGRHANRVRISKFPNIPCCLEFHVFGL
jgi:hypothetical protein